MKKVIGIYKVGGGVLNSKENIKRFVENSANIWPKSDPDDQVTRMFVISAFGHMTNLLQDVIHSSFSMVFGSAVKKLAEFCEEMGLEYFDMPIRFFNYEKEIGFLHNGEIFSSNRIEDFISSGSDYYVSWDAREIIKTAGENPFEAEPDLKLTQKYFNQQTGSFYEGANLRITIVTQGFIASDTKGNPTLLGREGSDYSAAIFAHCAKNSGLFDEVYLTFIKSTPGVSLDWREGDDQVEFEDDLTWEKINQMSEKGSKIFHPKVANLLKGSSIPTIVTDLNYFSSDDVQKIKTTIL